MAGPARHARRRPLAALTPALACALALACAGCVAGSGESRRAQARPAGLHAHEPYPVYLVNRSKFDRRFQPAVVTPPETHPPGSILVDTRDRLLYFYLPDGRARRYGVAVGAAGYAWSGQAVVGRKARWPAWRPTDEMRAEVPGLPQVVSPGPHNPLGARALYLYRNGRDTLYRIHGTSEPWTIGAEASSGCIRMLNEDIIELFDLVPHGAKVIVK